MCGVHVYFYTCFPLYGHAIVGMDSCMHVHVGADVDAGIHLPLQPFTLFTETVSLRQMPCSPYLAGYGALWNCSSSSLSQVWIRGMLPGIQTHPCGILLAFLGLQTQVFMFAGPSDSTSEPSPSAMLRFLEHTPHVVSQGPHSTEVKKSEQTCT